MTIIFDGNTAPWWAWVLECIPLIPIIVFIGVTIAHAIHDYRQSKHHK